jgi:citrate lyase beta subunit
VVEKLRREPVEDLRIDFEDGYGNRPDEIEDGHAVKVAEEVARGDRERLLPPGIGIRVKPLTAELHARSLRTLDLFVTTLACANAGALPANFCVTLPKITDAQQVATFVDVLELIERGNALTPGSIPIELMVETTQSIFGPDGSMPLLSFVAAGRGRVRGAHFGVYDYTASCNVTASHQAPGHHACEFARLAMQAALAGTGVTLSDGSSAVLPVPPHRVAAGRALTPEQRRENEAVVHGAWRVHFDDVRASLRDAYYQGWDLHPAHLPTRYAAVFSFFLEGREAAAQRLRAFVDKAAQATRLGSVFDDAATGQGLLNFFLRGLSCGALTEAEALESGLTLEELRGRSFSKILAGRG